MAHLSLVRDPVSVLCDALGCDALAITRFRGYWVCLGCRRRMAEAEAVDNGMGC